MGLRGFEARRGVFARFSLACAVRRERRIPIVAPIGILRVKGVRLSCFVPRERGVRFKLLLLADKVHVFKSGTANIMAFATSRNSALLTATLVAKAVDGLFEIAHYFESVPTRFNRDCA